MSREQRHAYLRANAELLARESPAAYQAWGRGFWLVAEWRRPGLTYMGAEAAASFEGEFRTRLAEMVRDYDPGREGVVVISEADDSIHVHRVAFVYPARS